MIKKLILAFVCLFIPAISHAQCTSGGSGSGSVTISGNLQDIGGVNSTGSSTFVRFMLAGYGSNIPKVTGSNAIATPCYDFRPNSSGQISGTIQGNDRIFVGANPAGGTQYQVCIYFQGQGFRCNNYTITGTSWNINNATPSTTNPTIPAPTGDNTSFRKEGGNSPIARATTVNARFTAPTPANLGSILWVCPSSSCQYQSVFAAYAALPSCTDANGNTFTHCGTIEVAPGTYWASSNTAISSPYVSIIGAGGSSTIFNVVGAPTNCAFSWTSSPATSNNNVGVWTGFDIRSDGTANACGIKVFDIAGWGLGQVSFANFTGSGAIGLIQANVNLHTERGHLANVWFNNNTIGWQIGPTVSRWETTGYGNFDISCTANAGQTCVSIVGASSGVQNFFGESLFRGVFNLVGAATAFKLAMNAHWDNFYQIHIEQTEGSGATGRSVDSTSVWTGMGWLSGANLDSLASASVDTSINFAGDTDSSRVVGSWSLVAPIPATPGNQTVNTSSLRFQGNCWNGSANINDTWGIFAAPAAGTSSSHLVFQQIGGCGSGQPAIQIPDGLIFGTAHSALIQIADPTVFRTYTIPDFGSNDSFVGAAATQTLSNKTFSNGLIAGGAAAALSGTGACAMITTQVGGAWSGSFKCTGTTGASTVTITPGTTAPNGWSCSSSDETAGLAGAQSGHSTTTCTVKFATVTQDDVLTFSANAF